MFKVGDRVKCVDGVGTTLVDGDSYVVKKVHQPGQRFVDVEDAAGRLSGGWYLGRFVSALPAFKGNK